MKKESRNFTDLPKVAQTSEARELDGLIVEAIRFVINKALLGGYFFCNLTTNHQEPTLPKEVFVALAKIWLEQKNNATLLAEGKDCINSRLLEVGMPDEEESDPLMSYSVATKVLIEEVRGVFKGKVRAEEKGWLEEKVLHQIEGLIHTTIILHNYIKKNGQISIQEKAELRKRQEDLNNKIKEYLTL